MFLLFFLPGKLRTECRTSSELMDWKDRVTERREKEGTVGLWWVLRFFTGVLKKKKKSVEMTASPKELLIMKISTRCSKWNSHEWKWYFWGRADDSEANNGMLSSGFLDPTAYCSNRRQCSQWYIYTHSYISKNKIFNYPRDSIRRKPVNYFH